MMYLLDVNALVALGFLEHEFHIRVARWLSSRRSIELGTSAITELGFVRVLSQAPAYALTVVQARSLLLRLKQARSYPLRFLADEDDISRLPSWVKGPRQVTDGHLSHLAKVHGGLLATLDENVPGSYLIPK